MNSELKELWGLRFEKILKLENESHDFYQRLLKENVAFLEGTRAKEILEGIMNDEAKHAQVAEELFKIVHDKKG